MIIGAHVSTKSPFSDAPLRAAEIGCRSMQIFLSPPQRWSPLPTSDSEIDLFNQKNKKVNISPIIVHGIYLINLASDNPFFYESSIRSLIHDMNLSAKIGAMGVNFHLGSTKGKDLSEVIDKIILGLKNILAATPENVDLILENSAGSGSIIGDQISEFAPIFSAVNSDRLKITLDTAHAFASGYDLRTKTGLEQLLGEVSSLIGLKKLACFHLNDSAVPLGSSRDRHADIGDGYIGLKTFETIINHPDLAHLPGIVETPGNKDKTDVDNIKILNKLSHP